MVRLNINKEDVEADVTLDTPLLWVLRDNLNLTGTKFSCGVGQCGACTVLLNGHPVRSCMTTAAEAQGYDIITIEGISAEGIHPVQQAFIEEDVPQCGYCQSGQVMSAIALLNEKSNPTDEEINTAMTNICRCGTYSRIRTAIRKVAQDRGET